VLSNQGKEAIVAIHNAGDFFGEGCLAGQPVRMAAASATTDCTVIRIEKQKGSSVGLTSLVNIAQDALSRKSPMRRNGGAKMNRRGVSN